MKISVERVEMDADHSSLHSPQLTLCLLTPFVLTLTVELSSNSRLNGNSFHNADQVAIVWSHMCVCVCMHIYCSRLRNWNR